MSSDSANLLDETKENEVVEKEYSLDPNDYPKGSWHRRQLEMWMLFEEPHTSNKALAVEISMVVLLFICIITLVVDLGVSNSGMMPEMSQLKQLQQLQGIQGMDPAALAKLSPEQLGQLPGAAGDMGDDEVEGAWWMGNSKEKAMNPPVVKEIILFVIESICMIAFTIEYVCRLLAAPVTVGVGSFICNFMNTIDLISILPYYMELSLMTYTGVWPWQLGAPHHPEKYLSLLRTIRLSRLGRLTKIYNVGNERHKPKHYKYY